MIDQKLLATWSARLFGISNQKRVDGVDQIDWQLNAVGPLDELLSSSVSFYWLIDLPKLEDTITQIEDVAGFTERYSPPAADLAFGLAGEMRRAVARHRAEVDAQAAQIIQMTYKAPQRRFKAQ